MESVTDKLSYRELWESWKPDRVESEHSCLLTAFTPMGIGIIRRVGDHELWSVEPSWAVWYLTVSSEDIAIQKLVESYRETESKVVKAYVNRLKVNLGEVDEHGYVWTPAGGYVIRRGVERIDRPRDSEPTGEIQTRETYILSYRGNKLGTNTDFHVWEDEITAAFQYELLKALNLV